MADAAGIDIKIEQRDGAAVVAPIGDVDLSRSPSLREALRKAQAAKPARLIIDLTDVDYMDSSGVATLVEALQMARRANTKMILCSLKEQVRSIFEITRLDTVFSIAPSVDAAMKA